MTDIYNPFCILNVCKSRTTIGSETVHPVTCLLNHTQQNLNELTNRFYTTQQFID